MMRRFRVCVSFLALLTFAIASDQPVGGQQTAPAMGTLERITVHGRALEGNLEGDSPDRPVVVYLPPSYARETNRRYPVLYFLHGMNGNEAEFERRGVAAAVEKLPERQRTVFTLCQMAEQSTSEVSQALGLSEATVRVHLFRAIRKLRKLLEHQR